MNTHLQYASPVMSIQPQFLSPLSSAQAQLTTSHTTQHVPNSQGATTNVLSKALPICPKPNVTSLPFSKISKEGLHSHSACDKYMGVVEKIGS